MVVMMGEGWLRSKEQHQQKRRSWAKQNCNGPYFIHAARSCTPGDLPGECQQAPMRDRQARLALRLRL